MAGVQDGINSDVSWCIYGWLGAGFVVDADGITLDIDKLVELGFSDRSFEVCSDGNLGVLLQELDMAWTMVLVDVLLVG